MFSLELNAIIHAKRINNTKKRIKHMVGYLLDVSNFRAFFPFRKFQENSGNITGI